MSLQYRTNHERSRVIMLLIINFFLLLLCSALLIISIKNGNKAAENIREANLIIEDLLSKEKEALKRILGNVDN